VSVHVFGDRESGFPETDELRCTSRHPAYENAMPAGVVVIFHVEAIIVGPNCEWCCPACGISSLFDAGAC
jgi:hypothetical protein